MNVITPAPIALPAPIAVPPLMGIIVGQYGATFRYVPYIGRKEWIFIKFTQECGKAFFR